MENSCRYSLFFGGNLHPELDSAIWLLQNAAVFKGTKRIAKLCFLSGFGHLILTKIEIVCYGS